MSLHFFSSQSSFNLSNHISENPKTRYDKIQAERRKNEAEVAAAIKQVSVEREDARRKIAEERQRLEDEKAKGCYFRYLHKSIPKQQLLILFLRFCREGIMD